MSRPVHGLAYVSFFFALSGAALAQPAPGAAPQALDERTAVKRALAANSSLVAADLEVEQAGHDVAAEEGRYPYMFQADAGYTQSRAPRLGPDDTVSGITSRSYTVGSALRRTFPVGTTAELRVQGERFENEGLSGAGLDASNGYGVSARASLNQPLLRGAGKRVGEAELRAARANREVRERSRARFESELVREVLVAYWELWYAGEAAAIERAALALAERQAKEAREQRAAGALAPASLYTFEARVAELEESVVTADVQREQRALELARLIGATEARSPDLVAVAPPPLDGPSASRAELDAALRGNSLELSELAAQIELSKTRAEVAGENERARLDLEAYFETQGVSEGVPRAAARAGQMNWVTAHVGLVFELPLDDSRRTAEKSSALLGVRIAEQNQKVERERLSALSTLTLSEEQAALRKLELSRRTLQVVEKAYNAERERFELGQSIAIQVQEAEDDLRRARLRAARARVDLATARAEVLHLANKLVSQYGG